MNEASSGAGAIPDHIEWVLEAARIAPSHDNLQPWRFLVSGESISFLVDRERDRSPGGARGAAARTARVAVGAAVECALLRAGRMGALVRFEEPANGALVTLTITHPKRKPEPDKALVRRTTNRRTYDARPIDDASFTWLSEGTPPLDGARTHWFGRERVRVLGPIVGEGEELYYADAALREAALRALHFDARDREEVKHGLSVGCLELTAGERMTLDTLRHGSHDRLGTMGVFRKMGARAQRLLESASGVCIVSIKGSSPAADVAVGRALQRAWLALTRRGLVAQPFAAIPILESGLANEDGSPVSGVPTPVTSVVTSLRAAFPNLERDERIGMLMRFGWAPPPTSSVRRLPLEDSVVTAPGT